MTILYLLPFVPTEDERPDPTHHLQLMSRKHDVVLLALHETERDLEKANVLTTWAEHIYTHRIDKLSSFLSCLRHLPTRMPLYVAYFQHAAIHKLVRELVHRHSVDLIHAHTIRMAPYATAFSDTPIVCDMVDVLTERYRLYCQNGQRNWLQRALDFEEWFKMKSFEKRTAERFGAVSFISSAEAAVMSALAPAAQCCVIEPSLDEEFFKPLPVKDRNGSVVFLGRFSYRPNAEAAERLASHIFPRIRDEVPGAELYLVGSDPPPSLRKLARQPGVHVTGRVPDVRPFVGRASVSCCPITSGGGVRLKILESLALGTPVVTTKLGAAGLGLLEEDGMSVAESDSELSSVAVKILKRGNEALFDADRGRQRIIQRYSFDRQLQAIDAFHHAGLHRHSQKSSAFAPNWGASDNG